MSRVQRGFLSSGIGWGLKDYLFVDREPGKIFQPFEFISCVVESITDRHRTVAVYDDDICLPDRIADSAGKFPGTGSDEFKKYNILQVSFHVRKCTQIEGTRLNPDEIRKKGMCENDGMDIGSFPVNAQVHAEFYRRRTCGNLTVEVGHETVPRGEFSLA